MLSLLAKLPNLTNLTLPTASELDLGFDDGPYCGNYYHGEKGRAFGRSRVVEHASVVETAADMAVKALPALKSLTIGDTVVDLTRNREHEDEGAILSMAFPWTGRLEEYALEQFPL